MYLQTQSFGNILTRAPIVGTSEECVAGMSDEDIGAMIRRGFVALRTLLVEEVEYHDAMMTTQKGERLSAKKKDRPAAVYLMRCRDRFKVGVSIDPDRRLRQVASGTTDPVDLVGDYWFSSEREAYRVEAGIHSALASHRSNREWFALPGEPNLRALIESVEGAT